MSPWVAKIWVFHENQSYLHGFGIAGTGFKSTRQAQRRVWFKTARWGPYMESVMAEASEMARIREERREKGWRKWELFPVVRQKEWCCRRSQMHKGNRRRKMVKKTSTWEAWSIGRTIGLDGRRRWVRTGERRKQTDKGENFCLKVIGFSLFINNLSFFFL